MVPLPVSLTSQKSQSNLAWELLAPPRPPKLASPCLIPSLLTLDHFFCPRLRRDIDDGHFATEDTRISRLSYSDSLSTTAQSSPTLSPREAPATTTGRHETDQNRRDQLVLDSFQLPQFRVAPSDTLLISEAHRVSPYMRIQEDASPPPHPAQTSSGTMSTVSSTYPVLPPVSFFRCCSSWYDGAVAVGCLCTDVGGPPAVPSIPNPRSLSSHAPRSGHLHPRCIVHQEPPLSVFHVQLS